MTEKRFRDADGNLLCDRCHGPIAQPPTGRRRLYCSRTCRELAYRERSRQHAIDEALKAAGVDPDAVSSTDAPPVTSVDQSAVTSVDETRVPPPRRLPSGMGLGMFIAPPVNDD
jgi:putative intracellular protease/amidase